MTSPEHQSQKRLTFDQAVAYARESGKAAFTAVPVFGDNQEAAEGAQVFIIEGEGEGEGEGHRVHFVAGPFFSTTLVSNEILADDNIPDRVRELQFTPTVFSAEWLSGQIQVLIGRLAQAAEIASPNMPNYLDMPTRTAAAWAVFPIDRIGRAKSPRAKDQP
jgi:hypothetical protein